MKTPCKKQCHVDPTTKACSGCFRYIDEIRVWTTLTEKEQEGIMKGLKLREWRLKLTSFMWTMIR